MANAASLRRSKGFIRNHYSSLLLAASFVFLFDRLSKAYLGALLAQTGTLKLGIVSLFYITNTGAAFSILSDAPQLLLNFSILVIGVLLYLIWRTPYHHPFLPYAFGLMLGGALSNLLDRIMYGHVIDFISIWKWPVFNIADSALTIGALSAAWILYHHDRQIGKKENLKTTSHERSA